MTAGHFMMVYVINPGILAVGLVPGGLPKY